MPALGDICLRYAASPVFRRINSSGTAARLLWYVMMEPHKHERGIPIVPTKKGNLKQNGRCWY
jgi:hypothetical protein